MSDDPQIEATGIECEHCERQLHQEPSGWWVDANGVKFCDVMRSALIHSPVRVGTVS